MPRDQRNRGRPTPIGQTTIRGVQVLQELLVELAFVLLPRGMTPKRFDQLARSAFVRVAADISRLRNGRVNHSRVAAQTGLSRAEVRKLLKEKTLLPGHLAQTPVERVLQGWRTDREFATRAGNPKRIRISGSGVSFARLVRRYGGDVTPRAVLEELRRLGAVIDSNGTVLPQLSRNIRQRHGFEFLSPVLPVLVDGLRIASRKAGLNAASSIHRLTLPAETEVDLAIVRDRCTSSAQSMLDGLAHSLGTQAATPRIKRSPNYSFSITILLAESGAKTN